MCSLLPCHAAALEPAGRTEAGTCTCVSDGDDNFEVSDCSARQLTLGVVEASFESDDELEPLEELLMAPLRAMLTYCGCAPQAAGGPASASSDAVFRPGHVSLLPVDIAAGVEASDKSGESVEEETVVPEDELYAGGYEDADTPRSQSTASGELADLVMAPCRAVAFFFAPPDADEDRLPSPLSTFIDAEQDTLEVAHALWALQLLVGRLRCEGGGAERTAAGGAASGEGDELLRVLQFLDSWLRRVPVSRAAAVVHWRLRRRLIGCAEGVSSVCFAQGDMGTVACENASSPQSAALPTAAAALARDDNVRERLTSEAREMLAELLSGAADADNLGDEAAGYCVRCLSVLLEDLSSQAACADATAGLRCSDSLSHAWGLLRTSVDVEAGRCALKALVCITGLRLLDFVTVPLHVPEARMVASAWADFVVQKAESVQSCTALAAPRHTSGTLQDVHHILGMPVHVFNSLAVQTKRFFLMHFDEDEDVVADTFRALSALEELRNVQNEFMESRRSDRAAASF